MKYLTFLILVCVLFTLVSCGVTTTTPIAGDVVTEPALDTTETTPSFEPITVVDNEFVTFTVKSIVYDEFWGTYGLKVFLENKTEVPVTFAWNEVSVNGYMCDPFWASEVAAGKKENTTITWWVTSFEENDIDYTKIETIEFVLDAYYIDTESWDRTTFVDNIFTLNINK